MRKYLLLAVALLAGAAVYSATTPEYIRRPTDYVYTSYPMYMAVVAPSDSTDLPNRGTVRLNTAGAVTVICSGNADGETVTLTMAAGESVPCIVRRVLDTGTDDETVTIHISY